MPTINDAKELTELFERRLVFVMGKGGVGKTTLAVSMAFAAEAAGKRVLLAETEDSQSVGRLFGEPGLTETPISVSKRIWIARINPKAELEAYTRFHIKSGFIARRVTRSRLFDYLSEATPGLREIMTLARTWRWEEERQKNGSPLYDMIIVDAPATGHALSLLRLPKMLIDMIRVGPIVSQIRGLQKLLKDDTKTWLTLVCLPEELPVKESLELINIARDELEIPVQRIFLNAIYPPLFSSEEAEHLKALMSEEESGPLFSAVRDKKGLRKVLHAARHQYSRRRINTQYSAQLRAEATGPIIEIPYYFKNDLNLEDLRRIASNCLDPEKRSQDDVHAGKHR